MKFEEKGKDVISVPSQLMGKCYVYFLLDGDNVVYVGQTQNGIVRPFSHLDKEFDGIRLIPCERYLLNCTERNYILKYSPKYNHSLPGKKTNSIKEFRSDVFDMFGVRLSDFKIKRFLESQGFRIYTFKGKCYLLTADWCDALKSVSLSDLVRNS